MAGDFKTLAEYLLQRPLSEKDAIVPHQIESAEKTTGYTIPITLKTFYLEVGSLPLFMDSFQTIYPPGELIEKGQKLVFMEENQSACYWAVDVNDSGDFVYQGNDTEPDLWYPEEINLKDFLLLAMYYQYLQSSSYQTLIPDEQLMEKINTDFTKVIAHNGLMIHTNEHKIYWWYYSDAAEQMPAEVYETSIVKDQTIFTKEED